MSDFKVGQRVRFTDKPYLSEGYVKEIVRSPFGPAAWHIIKLDEKAPNEYAWETDEVLSLGDDIEAIK